MFITIICALLFGVLIFAVTLLIGKYNKGEQEYHKKSKSYALRYFLIYGIVAIVSFVALGVFIASQS